MTVAFRKHINTNFIPLTTTIHEFLIIKNVIGRLYLCFLCLDQLLLIHQDNKIQFHQLKSFVGNAMQPDIRACNANNINLSKVSVSSKHRRKGK